MKTYACLLASALVATAPAADLVPPEAVALFDLVETRALPALTATTYTWDVPFELAPEMTLRYEAALRLVSLGQLEGATRLLDQQKRTRQVRDDARFWFLDGELLRPRNQRISLQSAYARAAQLAPDVLYEVIRARLAELGLPRPPPRLPAGEAPTAPPEQMRRQFEALARALACGDRRHQASFTDRAPEEVRPGPSEDEEDWDALCEEAVAAVRADKDLARALRNYVLAVPRLPWTFLGGALADPRDWFVGTLLPYAPVEEFPRERLRALLDRAREDPYLAWRLLSRAFELILVGRSEEAAALARPFVDAENLPLAHLSRMVLDDLGEVVPLAPENFRSLLLHEMKFTGRPPPYLISGLRADPSLRSVLWDLVLHGPRDDDLVQEDAIRLPAGDLLATFGSWDDRIRLLRGTLTEPGEPGAIDKRYRRGLYQGIVFHGIGHALEEQLGGDIPAALRKNPSRVLEAMKAFAATQSPGPAILAWRTTARRQVQVPARLRFPVDVGSLSAAQRSALETMPLDSAAVSTAVTWTWGPPEGDPPAPGEAWARALVSVGRPAEALAAARAEATTGAASPLLVGDLLRFAGDRDAIEAAYQLASLTGGPVYEAVVAARLEELAAP